jgi:DNA-directed RNA polymerase subunit RPC12/RpoP
LIIKEVDYIETNDKFLKAGLSAENQMAYYLQREFKDDENVLILNGIRLESDGDSTQIDHLIMHRYGMVIVESKSVYGTVEINDHGEWHRAGSDIGMPSPIEQAKRQATFLKKYLGKSKLKPAQGVFESLFRDATYEDINVEVLIAISDTGIINRSKNTSDDKIYKADMITGKIKELIRYYKDNESPFNFDSKSAPMTLNAEDRKKIAEYLTKNHTPLMFKSPRVVSFSHTPEIRKINCQACGSIDVIILYGKFGYYFECKKCHKTTSIKEKCEKCGKQLKPHKDGNHFYIKCEDCGTSKLFFTNQTL